MTVPEAGPGSRMDEFEREVARLKVRQGGGPESRLLALGVALFVAGIVMIAYAWFKASETAALNEQIDYLISGALAGLGITVIGVALYLRAAMARHLRLWMIRMAHEQQAQTDRTVEALERIEAALTSRP